MPAELETVITAVSPVVDWTDVAGDAKHTAAVPEVHSVAWQATAPIRSDAVKSALPKLMPQSDSFPPDDEGAFANAKPAVIAGASNEKIDCDVPTNAWLTVVAVRTEAPAPEIEPQMRIVQDIQDDVEHGVPPSRMDMVRSGLPRLQPCMLRANEAPFAPELAGQELVIAGVS